LFQHYFFQVDFSAVVKGDFQILPAQFFPRRLQLFWKIDQVKRGVNRKLEGNETPAAHKAEERLDLALDKHFLSDFFDGHLRMQREKENRVFFDNFIMKELKIFADLEPFSGESVNI
jgi:hypothetical protein